MDSVVGSFGFTSTGGGKAFVFGSANIYIFSYRTTRLRHTQQKNDRIRNTHRECAKLLRSEISGVPPPVEVTLQFLSTRSFSITVRVADKRHFLLGMA